MLEARGGSRPPDRSRSVGDRCTRRQAVGACHDIAGPDGLSIEFPACLINLSRATLFSSRLEEGGSGHPSAGLRHSNPSDRS